MNAAKAGIEPRSAALESDALTARPTRQSLEVKAEKDVYVASSSMQYLLCALVCVCLHFALPSPASYRLVGLVVKASAWRAEGPGFESHWRRDFFGIESYQ